jgi:8-oxo-dGTP pyrophosphatase MutT (NUDIX family)
MNAAAAPTIHRVVRLDLRVRAQRWEFAEARRADIAAHFAQKQREKPKLFNGAIMLARHADFSGSCFRAEYFQTDFASFLAWRDWGFPDREVFNGFGMGALRSSDGAFVLGEMAQHTANAGRVYFPAGTPDLDDVSDGVLDIAGSIGREVAEETGLTPADYKAEPDWHCVVTAASVAVIQILDVDMSGEALRAQIEANLSAQAQPELSAIHLVREVGDLTAAMPRFVTGFLEAQFASQ